MEVGQAGVPGLDVQSAVEGEPRPDPDLVPILHLNMEETTVLELQAKMLNATKNLVRVCISTRITRPTVEGIAS